MHDMKWIPWREWVRFGLAAGITGIAGILVATIATGVAMAQGLADRDTWTFARDSSNNLVIQDLDAFTASQGLGTAVVCLQFRPVCPSSFDRRANDLRLARSRYTLRGIGGRETDWRIDLGDVAVRSTGTTSPFQVGGVEQGMVQVVSSAGPWTVDLQRIPATELRVGDGKRWNVFLTLSDVPQEGSVGCWLEVACPEG